MERLSRIITTALVALSLCYSGDLNRFDVYDYVSNKFKLKKGGLDEDILNATWVMEKLKKAELESVFIEYADIVDKTENEYEFSPDEGDPEGAKKFFYKRVKLNSKFISLTDSIPSKENISFVVERYIDVLERSNGYYKSIKRLKEMTDKLNELYDPKMKTYENLIKLYMELPNWISVGEPETRSNDKDEGLLAITQLVDGREGNCSDIAAAYYSVLNHYNIPTYFKFGKSHKKDEKGAYHVWISCDTEIGSIELDPTFYGWTFIPIEERNKEIKKESVY